MYRYIYIRIYNDLCTYHSSLSISITNGRHQEAQDFEIFHKCQHNFAIDRFRKYL